MTAYFRSRVERLAVFTLLIWFIGEVPALSAAEQPNVLLIMADDQGWGDIAAHGAPQLKTPVLDRLAAVGVQFDRFYVSPVCAPTRASLLSGRYSLRTGVSGVTRGYENMRGSELTIAECLRCAGYSTGCFGKWHNGRHLPMHPNGQGFDEFFGFCGGHWNTYFDTPLEHNGERVETSGYITDVITDAALKFIRERQGQPWFCYVPYNAPHSPWRVPDEFYAKYQDKGLDETAACAYAMIECVDASVGRLLAELKRLQLDDDTLVLFLTDNGPNSPRFNGGMRGTKGSVHEGGVRVPLFVKWGDRLKPHRVEQIAAHIDLLPTILEACGVELPDGPQLDGLSLWPLIANTDDVTSSWPERILLTTRESGTAQSRSQFRGAARSQRWRATFENGRWSLFDMLNDPGQKIDVATQHSDELKRLSTAWNTYIDGLLADGFEEPEIPVDAASGRTLELPGHEAFLESATGNGIRYAGVSGFANCWVTDWTDCDATLLWNLNVISPGQWKVVLEYAATPEQSGSKLEIVCGESRREFVVEQSHDSPFVPVPERLIPSPHYSVRSWATQAAGIVRLPSGKQTLILRGLHRPGSAFPEIKSVQMRRVGD
ncbi:sulfatase-like hydrolase/transferase [bacterium]|nr:sulfatase-like hydrolase/transferase [bacterium]